MTGIGMVRSARKDVVQLQSALTAVDAGLETVEVAAEAVEAARRGLRRVLPVLLVIGVVGLVVGVAVAVRSRLGNRVEPAPPEPAA